MLPKKIISKRASPTLATIPKIAGLLLGLFLFAIVTASATHGFEGNGATGGRDRPPNAAAWLAFGEETINASDQGGSRKTGPPKSLSGWVMVIDVWRDGEAPEDPVYMIEAVSIQPGFPMIKRPFRMTAHSSPQSATPAKPEHPALAIFNAQGEILHEEVVVFPALQTIPPQSPQKKADDLPAVIPLQVSEATLVVPYFPEARTVSIVHGRKKRVMDTMPVGHLHQPFLNQHDQENSLFQLFEGPTRSNMDMLNIILIASGFTLSEIADFEHRAFQIQDLLFSMEPFAGRLSQVNLIVHFQTSSLGCNPNCYNIERLMCCNTSAVISAAAASGHPYDEIIILHNTSIYSGGGYRESGDEYKHNSAITYAMVYSGVYTAQVAMHEFGHSFGNLCDEYSIEGYFYQDCVNYRASCDDWTALSDACLMGCDSEPFFFRPENSIMRNIMQPYFNAPSILARYFPDGLEKRLEFFAPLPQYGSIRVDIEPNQAVEAGAKWRFYGTPGWFDSGHTEPAVPAGVYTVAFKEIDGWTSPPEVDVSVNEGELTEVTEWYERITFQAGDLDDDGDVDGMDLYHFTIAYISSHPDADLNHDGMIGSADVALFAQEYGWIYPSD